MAAVTTKNFDISHSMDSLAARREARRRKILENAENRLKKLTGVEQKSNVTIDDFQPINYGSNESNLSQTRYYQNESLSYNSVLTSHLIESSNNDSNVSSEVLQNNGNQHKASVIEHKGYKFCSLLGIAFFANILLMFANSASDETDGDIGCSMIFIPFFGYKLMDFLINRNITENGLLQLVLMMNMKSDILKRILIYIPYLTYFTQDLFVYFFIFMVTNQIFGIIFWLR